MAHDHRLPGESEFVDKTGAECRHERLGELAAHEPPNVVALHDTRERTPLVSRSGCDSHRSHEPKTTGRIMLHPCGGVERSAWRAHRS
ncbi:hypothetical protein ACFPRL_11195 [Pseudoclavibacter helvolus]